MGLGDNDEVLNTPKGDPKPNLSLKEQPEQIIEVDQLNMRSSPIKKGTPQIDRKITGKRIRNEAESNSEKKSGKSMIKIKSLNNESMLNPENPFQPANESCKISISGQCKSKCAKKAQNKILLKE